MDLLRVPRKGIEIIDRVAPSGYAFDLIQSQQLIPFTRCEYIWLEEVNRGRRGSESGIAQCLVIEETIKAQFLIKRIVIYPFSERGREARESPDGSVDLSEPGGRRRGLQEALSCAVA